jgi:nitroimidazol reductase NimA-like FMN-containing flavoprotein (pyridoxamine 5'-phosphate oxidase superfamily)
MPASMTPDEVNAFLDSRPGWVILTTIGRDGYPHSVPIGYFRKDNEIYMGGRLGTQRAKNIQRNPKVSLLVESGTTMADIKGVIIQGDAGLITEPDAVLPLLRDAARYRGTPEDQLPTEVRPGVAYVRVKPRKVISWDYGKE